MKTKTLPSERSYLAPDGSEIRLLLDLEDRKGGLAHCVLPAGGVSVAQRQDLLGLLHGCCSSSIATRLEMEDVPLMCYAVVPGYE
jgi:hypothetical protein